MLNYIQKKTTNLNPRLLFLFSFICSTFGFPVSARIFLLLTDTFRVFFIGVATKKKQTIAFSKNRMTGHSNSLTVLKDVYNIPVLPAQMWGALMVQ